MGFRVTYLHFTLAHYKGQGERQGEGHAYFLQTSLKLKYVAHRYISPFVSGYAAFSWTWHAMASRHQVCMAFSWSWHAMASRHQVCMAFDVCQRIRCLLLVLARHGDRKSVV